MTMKFSKVMSYYKGLHRKKLRKPFNTWLHEVTQQIEYLISLLPQLPWPLNKARWSLTMSNFHR